MSRDITVNQRRFLRFNAKQGNVSGNICDRDDSELRNISLGGASFLLKKPIVINSACNVEIMHGDKKFQVYGRVAWARKPGEMNEVPESRKGMHTIGVVFFNTYDSESGTNLADLIDRLDT